MDVDLYVFYNGPLYCKMPTNPHIWIMCILQIHHLWTHFLTSYLCVFPSNRFLSTPFWTHLSLIQTRWVPSDMNSSRWSCALQKPPRSLPINHLTAVVSVTVSRRTNNRCGYSTIPQTSRQFPCLHHLCSNYFWVLNDGWVLNECHDCWCRS